MAMLAASLLVVIGVGGLVSQRLATVREGAVWVAHAERLRFELAAFLQTLSDLGSGVTVYQLTQDPSVFDIADHAELNLPAALQSLRRMVVDNAAEKQALDALILLANRRQIEASEVKKLARAGNAQAVERALEAGTGRSIMLAARTVVADLQKQEQAVLDRRAEEAETAYRVAVNAVFLSVLVAVASLLVVTIVALRDGERLRESQEELATTLRSVGDAVISTDATGAIRFMNQVAEQLTGWGARAARDRPLAEVFHIVNEQTRGAVESPVVKVLREEKAVGLADHTILIAKDGTERPIEDSCAPIRGESGDVTGVVLVFRDATLERAAKAQLLQSEERFRAAVDAVNGVLWTNTAQGEMRGEQPGWAALTGQAFDEYQGFGWAAAVHPEDAAATVDAWLEAVQERRLFVFEHRVRRHDGLWRIFSIRAIPIMDGVGAIRQWVGVHTDITEQRNAEQALRARERQFAGFANAIPQLAWTESPDGTHDYFNRGWYTYTGLTQTESLTRDGWTRVIHAEELNRAGELWSQSRATGTPYEIELRLRRHDGVYRWFLVRAIADADSVGTIVQWFGTCTDVDLGRRNQEALKVTEAALREANSRKDIFLATLSHELRNPLAPIRSAARLLELSTTEEQRSRSVAVISRQVHHMASLLDDLMDVSRITRGALTLKKAQINLRDLLETAVEAALPLITEKKHHLVTEWPKDNRLIEADPVRLTQVASNLLTNAAKYTDSEGEIIFAAQFDGDRLELSVRDSGIGIPPAMVDHVFEMFAQVQSSTERSQGGLGIGLGLVKAIVELHGGTIQARSAGANQGSEFIVSLPGVLHLMTPTKSVTSLANKQQYSQRQVMIADDNQDAAQSLGMLLELSGHKVHLAHSGPEAVALAMAVRPDVIILDIGMPGLTGYDVARQLRREPTTAQAILVAVTGWGQASDKATARDAGFDHHLTKPVNFDDLARLI